MSQSCPSCGRKLPNYEITGGICSVCRHKLPDRVVAENGNGINPPAWLPYSQSKENEVENDSNRNSNKLAQTYGRAVPVFRCPNCGHVGSAGQGGGGITPMMDLPKKDDDSQIRVIFNQSYRCCANCGYQNIIPAGEIYLCKCPNCLTKLNANALGRTQCTPCGHIFDLKEKKGCFIATAAYGTPLSEDVLLLRKLRDDWLINKCWGRIFVQVYYQISPFFADFIKQRPLYQSFVRKLLRPLIWFLKRTYKK